MWRLAILLIYSCLAMKPIDLGHHATGGTGMHMENIIRPESTWLVVITKNHGLEDKTLKETVLLIQDELAKDGCMLHPSKYSERQIILIVHCPRIEIVDEEEKIQTPLLTNTEAFLATTFGRENVLIGRNGMRSNTQWSGTYENINTIMKGEHLSNPGYRVLNEQQVRTLSDAKLVQHHAPWNLDRVDMRFGLPTGDYFYLNDASDVDVYVMDTGIRTSHHEFEGRATFLYNTINDKIDTDCNGHGTHVAGIIGGKTYGVAKKVKLYAVRVLDCKGDGTIDNILEGADVIIGRATERGARRAVINLSLGGDKSAIIDAMIARLKSYNIVVILAAGNSGADACKYSPSNMGKDNQVLSVGASDNRDYRTSFSNYGDCVNIFAPGGAITSAWFSSDTAFNTISGTSMAAPMTAGVAALVLHQDLSLTVDAVNAIVVRSATPGVISYAKGPYASLLYSLANVSDDVVRSPPAPARDQSGVVVGVPTLQTNDAGGSDSGSAAANAILCISITLLGLLCMG